MATGNNYKQLGVSKQDINAGDFDKITVVKRDKRILGKASRSPKKNVILPSHRLIYKHYKEQGFRSLAKAIRKTDAFAETTAYNSSIISNSKSWKALMDEKLPQEHVAKRHAELLDKRDYRKVVGVDGNITEVDNGPDTAAVTKGVELAYKLRGAFKKEDDAPPSTVMYNLFYKPEVRDQMKVFEEGIKQSLTHEIARKHKADIKEEEENQALIDSQKEEE